MTQAELQKIINDKHNELGLTINNNIKNNETIINSTPELVNTALNMSFQFTKDLLFNVLSEVLNLSEDES